MDLGMGEILLILVVALVVYGGRLPEVARTLGKTIGTLKKSLADTTAGVTRDLDPRLDLRLEDDRPRTVRRVAPAPAPAELATEDISVPADGSAAVPADVAARPVTAAPTRADPEAGPPNAS